MLDLGDDAHRLRGRRFRGLPPGSEEPSRADVCITRSFPARIKCRLFDPFARPPRRRSFYLVLTAARIRAYPAALAVLTGKICADFPRAAEYARIQTAVDTIWGLGPCEISEKRVNCERWRGLTEALKNPRRRAARVPQLPCAKWMAATRRRAFQCVLASDDTPRSRDQKSRAASSPRSTVRRFGDSSCKRLSRNSGWVLNFSKSMESKEK
jgi:hypothetical protein